MPDHASTPDIADFAARLARYGFTECSALRHFIMTVCTEPPAPCDLLYIRTMLRACLDRHDNDSAWFDDLRIMVAQVEQAFQYRTGHLFNRP